MAFHAGQVSVDLAGTAGYRGRVESMTCPSCQQQMHTHQRAGVPVTQCEGCRGIFLQRSDLADLVDAENGWHANSGQYTQPLPRISPEMTAPPKSSALTKRSFLDTLFS